jgi:hypothetical protein
MMVDVEVLREQRDFASVEVDDAREEEDERAVLRWLYVHRLLDRAVEMVEELRR